MLICIESLLFGFAKPLLNLAKADPWFTFLCLLLQLLLPFLRALSHELLLSE